MVKCTFCGYELAEGTGKMYVFKTGKIYYYCSRKCQKNHLELGRKPLKTHWTHAYFKEKAKLLASKKHD